MGKKFSRVCCDSDSDTTTIAEASSVGELSAAVVFLHKHCLPERVKRTLFLRVQCSFHTKLHKLKRKDTLKVNYVRRQLTKLV